MKRILLVPTLPLILLCLTFWGGDSPPKATAAEGNCGPYCYTWADTGNAGHQPGYQWSYAQAYAYSDGLDNGTVTTTIKLGDTLYPTERTVCDNYCSVFSGASASYGGFAWASATADGLLWHVESDGATWSDRRWGADASTMQPLF